jgi:hypothetical protein
LNSKRIKSLASPFYTQKFMKTFLSRLQRTPRLEVEWTQ